jgi:hypothetical protein
MKNELLLGLCALGLLAACGDDGGGNDSGGGSQTLLVQGSVGWDDEDGVAGMHVSVLRNGAGVNDATVTFRSDLGEVTLVRATDKNGEYYGSQVGWAGAYRLDVSAGEDSLYGSIAAPEQMTLVSPESTEAIDAHALPDGVLTLRWSGDAADTIRVRSADFEYEGVDEGHVDMPAIMLKESSQELRLRRDNSIGLAGGVDGSTLSASCGNDYTLIVVNPY